MATEWLFPTETSHEENVSRSKHEDLFVFGYACKLFRDDEQAKAVDKGKYMIPWMGDERLRIDRYDGRGHLYDLGPYDADNMKGQPQDELSEEEKQIEQLCDEERYLELHTDLAEKSMYEEEEWKRYYESLAEGYKAVGFSYDSHGQPQQTQEVESPEKPQDPSELPYEPPASLQVPQGMHIPATVKEQAIVEKTAKFIAEHGVQMEIMMKTKQANNPQFQFMHFENTLHPFYRHMVKMIKSKKYIPVTEPKNEDSHNDSGEAEDGAHGYLHPTLVATNRASPTPEVYKPIQVQMPKVSIHETSYGQLLQSLSKVNQTHEEKKNKNKEMKKEVKVEPQDQTSLASGVGQSVYSQNNMPPPPGIEPVTLPKPSDDSPSTDVKQEPQNIDSEQSSTSPLMPQIVPPPPDAQPVVDRMAMYVAKNGEEFEVVVKSKNDQRFQFLESWHVHYGYYLFKKQLFIQEMEKERKKKEEEEKQAEREKAEKLAKGVKFKLKKAKEQEGSALGKKVVFDNDESSDDEQGGEGRKEHRNKSDRSGTSTPVIDADPVANTRNDEMLEKKLAEQRVKDRLAASAREKLSQVDKEKQIKAERKKKAALFINLLKSKTSGDADSESKIDVNQPTPTDSGRSSPVKQEDRSSHHKSKHKSRDRSRDRNRSRSRSRSRSSSRAKKKKRRRSPTPPSAYATTRRSPLRLPPPPPPPRYSDTRTRYSRSPSQSKRSRRPSRSRSRSPSRSKPKSKKKKRSRSPRSRQEESSHRKSSKKKKKRSRSRSRDKRSSKGESVSDIKSAGVTPPASADPRVTSPAAVGSGLSAVVEELEDGETRDSSPEPGELEETDQKDELFKYSGASPDKDSIGSGLPADSYRTRSETGSPMSSPSSSRSPSPCKRSKNEYRSQSRSPYVGNSTPASHVTAGDSDSFSREGTPAGLDRVQNGAGDDDTTTSVSKYMLSRVREIIKASKKAVREPDEEEMEDT